MNFIHPFTFLGLSLDGERKRKEGWTKWSVMIFFVSYNLYTDNILPSKCDMNLVKTVENYIFVGTEGVLRCENRLETALVLNSWLRNLGLFISSLWGWESNDPHSALHIVKVKVAQSCPTLFDPMDRSLPGFSIHGIFQARVLEWGAIACSGAKTMEKLFPLPNTSDFLIPVTLVSLIAFRRLCRKSHEC